jgi:hypothetical protein
MSDGKEKMNMPIKTLHFVFCLVIVAGLLTACGGAPAVQPTGTMEFLTTPLQPAATPVPPAATSTFAPPPAAPPAAVLPVGTYGPYPSDLCESLRAAIEQTLAAPVTMEIAAFTDPMTNETGVACRIHASGNGQTFGMIGPMNNIVAQLQALGWSEDYGAGGPTTNIDGFRKRSALAVLTVQWNPSADANCPKDQPISVCNLAPEQKLFDVTLEIAQKVVYVPLPEDQCAAMFAMLQQVISIPVVLETVAFADPQTGDIGTSCRIHGIGNGNNFNNYMDPYNAIKAQLVPLGWVESSGGGGPTGTMGGFVSGNTVAVVFVGWSPSPDANCPKDQPIASCNLTPEQKLYEITVDFAQK